MATNFVARDGDKLAYPPLLFVQLCWHFTTDGNITMPIVALTLTMIPHRLITIREIWSSNPWDLLVRLIRRVGAHMAKISKSVS